jgi:hypothetical protein
MLEWLKGALATVYGKDGLVGIAVIVGLVLVSVAAVVLLGIDVSGLAGLFGG